MTLQDKDKVYHRQFLPESGESLALVAEQIPDGSYVLDVGCGAGDLGEFLKNEKQCRVVGVDYSTESVALAAQKLDSVKQIDLNQETLDKHLDGLFDVIIMADILEHIYTPIDTLRSAEKLLKPDGKVLISIPNAGYVGALMSLYDDSWHYQEEGILDRTHIRFYTKQSVLDLLADSGFDGVICNRVTRDLLDTEFTQRLDSQPDSVRDWLLAKPEGSTYQFIIEARPKTQHYAFPTEMSVVPMSMQHIVKCYWQSNIDSSFNAQQFSIQRGQMGKSNQLLFETSGDNIHKLRLDFADRRSIYQIDKVDILSGDTCVWSTMTDAYQLICENTTNTAPQLPANLLAIDSTANCELRLSRAVKGTQLCIRVSIHAPVGEQNITFSDAISLSEYQRVRDEQQRLATELAKMSAESGAYIAKLEETLQHERYVAKEEKQQLINLREQDNLNHQHNVEKLEANIQQLQVEYNNQKRFTNELLQSSSWKVTAPLRKVISLLK